MTVIFDIQAVSSDASGVFDIKPSRYERDDLLSAKEKVIDKLTRSKAFAESDCKVDDDNTIDACFYEVPQRNGYFVGIKYGNRWVKSVFGENKNKYGPLSKEQLIRVIDLLSKGVQGGEFDEQIKDTMMH